MIRQLKTEHDRKKAEIRKRLKSFRAVGDGPEEGVFSELCFCICTPQSKAVYCDKAVSSLRRAGTLFEGGLDKIRAGLTGVRFPNNKAAYIIEARELFTCDGRIKIKSRIDRSDIKGTRLWFAHNVKGVGLKEASHFLRNIGFGDDLAILDVHILRNMARLGIIKEVPGSISEKIYLEMEHKLEKFSKKISIPMAELDLVLWSRETGVIFK